MIKQVGVIGLGNVPGADQRAVAQHRDAVGELEHFFHAMADVDDGDDGLSLGLSAVVSLLTPVVRFGN